MPLGEALVLENTLLRVTFLPESGGKIASILERSTGAEYLLPPAAPYRGFDAKLLFADSDRGGFDECLPSVSACPSSESTPSIPDHGELWHVPWQRLESSPRVRLAAKGANSGLSLIRTASLDGAALRLQYQLQNCSDQVRQWLWSSHPLFSVDAGDQILLPDEVSTLAVDYASTGGLQRGDVVDWPRNERPGNEVDFGLVQTADGKTSYKLFATLRKDGWCAVHRKQLNRIVVLRFDPLELPHLGLWICFGAWPEDRDPKQYTVALEPCTAGCDSLTEAIAAGTARALNPGESTTWSLTLEVLKEDGKTPI